MPFEGSWYPIWMPLAVYKGVYYGLPDAPCCDYLHAGVVSIVVTVEYALKF